jgi:anti-sigma regulatory factor (Ser/Thr protein kinase)
MIEKNFPARADQLEAVQSFIADQIKSYPHSRRVDFQICVAVEEIFINIASYAYRSGEGEAVVRCGVKRHPLRVLIQFLDSGEPFNPLLKKDADIKLSAREREIGGLGILMVKKTMDSVEYRYENGQNILTIQKTIEKSV